MADEDDVIEVVEEVEVDVVMDDEGAFELFTPVGPKPVKTAVAPK